MVRIIFEDFYIVDYPVVVLHDDGFPYRSPPETMSYQGES